MDSIHVLLVRPPSNTGGTMRRVGGITPPLNLLYLAGYVKRVSLQKGIPVVMRVLDMDVNPLEVGTFKQDLASFQPRVVGFTVHTNNMPVVARLARIVKGVVPGATVILGGPHPTVAPADTLESIPSVDLVARGEGERVLADVLEAIYRGTRDFLNIPGLYLRGASGVMFTGRRELLEQFEYLLPPDRSVVDLSRYLKYPQSPGIWKRTANVFTQRGCPYNCAFCASPVIHDKHVRFFPIPLVIQEMKELVQAYKITHVTFRDSNFTLNRSRCVALCKAIAKDVPGITWNCETRVNLVDEPLLKLMKAAGCIKISFGVESGSPRVLDAVNKGVSIAHVKRAFKACKKLGIMTQAYFMVGFPDEGPRDVGLTIALIREIQPDFLFVSIVVPLPGTQVRLLFEQGGLLEYPADHARFQFFSGVPGWRTACFTMEQLVSLQRAVYASYIFTPGYVLRMVTRLRSISQVRYYLVALVDFIEFYIKRGRERVA